MAGEVHKCIQKAISDRRKPWHQMFATVHQQVDGNGNLLFSVSVEWKHQIAEQYECSEIWSSHDVKNEEKNTLATKTYRISIHCNLYYPMQLPKLNYIFSHLFAENVKNCKNANFKNLEKINRFVLSFYIINAVCFS